MISLFLLIFAFQNGIAAGELTLHDLQLTVQGLNAKMTSLEAQVHDLQSEVKSLKVKNAELETIVEMKEIEESGFLNASMSLNAHCYMLHFILHCWHF